MGGFLTTLTQAWNENPADPAFESRVAPGMPLQVLCYERADDIAAGVSGVVTRAQGIRASFPDLNPAEIPMAAAVTQERVLYLLDPDRRQPPSRTLRCARCLAARAGPLARRERRRLRAALDARHSCTSRAAWCCRIGQFNQWVGAQLMASGLVQIWPGTPVSAASLRRRQRDRPAPCRSGRRPARRAGRGSCPAWMCTRALTVVGDGPVGAVGQAIDQQLGHARRAMRSANGRWA